jgi:hypothetical protein
MEIDYLEAPSVDRYMLLRWIFRKWFGEHGLDRSKSEPGQMAGTCKYGNKHLVSIKSG